MINDRKLIAPMALCAALAMQACSDAPEAPAETDIVATDPLLAQALADPLMVDPDLAYRSEANAAVTLRYDHSLPPLVATDELAERASSTARLELLKDGPILELPLPVSSATLDLASAKDAREMVQRVGGPSDCAARLEDGLGWAARMPGPSAIMPHGMVRQAAGADGETCSLRVVRYLSPASFDDILQFHFTQADRARLPSVVYEKPERAIVGDGRDQKLVVHVRQGPGGLSAVDLIYWKT